MISRHEIQSVDPYLTNLSIAYGNRPDGFIASKLFPILNTEGKRTGRYRKWGKGLFREYEDEMPRLDHANRIQINLDDDGTFACVVRAMEDGIADRDRGEFISQSIDLAEVINRYLTDAVLVGRERRVATIAASSSYMTNYSALSVADRWDNYTSADSDPFDDVDTMRASIHSKTGLPMNTIVLGRQVYDKVKHHPLILDRIKYTMAATGRNITPELLAAAFDVETVIVGDALYITSKEGQTETLGYIWGKNVIGAYVDPAPSNMSQTLGLIPSVYGNAGLVTTRWYDEGAEGEFIRVKADEDEILVEADCGYLLQTVVS